ncbi:MAG: DNA gyrase subunit A [Ruminococcaceae bacterium]|nr:DNA gyrase subunit A [Oscillospiraceae bacterium]
MEKNKNYEFKDQKIIGIQMEKEVKKSFIEYAMSVIVSRALPDVRDGLKPVHRRILYSMYEEHLTHDRPYRKSATTVGYVLGHYHPHGDSSVYDAMVRLAQPFNMRYTLVDGQGNFGNVDGDSAAAYRYTEARMTKLANELLRDIEKDVVDFAPNFDNKAKEPTVLPTRFPNLLVNGSMGIAVGMATNIPPHNLGEVIDGTIHLIDHPDATLQDLMQFIKGPDFPTGALICGTSGIYSAYATGKGKIMVRARCEIEEEKHRIVVTEIPYQVNKAEMVKQIAECHKDKRVEGITGLRDETGSDGMRIVIEYRKDANGEVVLNQLYKHTALQSVFAANMLAIVNNVPRILSLKEILQHYIAHQKEVVERRTRFDLNKALAEMHIYEGYRIAIDHIDEVIAIIKASASIADAKEKLMERFGFSEIQAQAIVDMTLGKLSGLERQKIEDRLAKLRELVAELQGILADEGKIYGIIKDEMLFIKEKYADERRTELAPAEDDIVLEDLIERHTCVITMSHAGYIKRLNSDTYSAQRRGGKGIVGMTTKEEDFVENVIAVNSHSYLMMFTNLGKVQMIKAYQIPEAGRTAKGTNIVNILELEEGEKITAMLSVADFDMEDDKEEYLLFVTKQGTVKRTKLCEFAYKRKGGKRALTLDEGDELIYVRHTTGSDEVIIATEGGYACRFDENDARVMGRSARGVRGIRLTEGDAVAGVALVDDSKKLVTVTKNGFGKRSDFADFACHNRGGKGVTCHNVSEKTGRLAGIASVSEDEDLMLISSDGVVIRVPVSDVPCYSRTAGGVIVMRMPEDTEIVNFTVVESEKDEDGAQNGADENEEIKIVEITDEV